MGKAINELDNAGALTDATLVPVGETDTLKKSTWAAFKAAMKTYIEGAIGTAQFRALLDDATAADQRTTLGLGDSSTKSVGTTAGTVAAGDDSRLSNARTPTSHTHALADLTKSSASTGQVATWNGSAWAPATPSAGGSGTKTLAVFSPLANQPPASAFATLDTRNSVPVLDFDAAADESAVFSAVVPESATLTSGIVARLVWMATSATSGNVQWRVAFERRTTDQDADSFDTATEATDATNGTSGICETCEITCTTIDSIVAGDSFRVRITRVGTDATNDTMTGDAELVAVELRAA